MPMLPALLAFLVTVPSPPEMPAPEALAPASPRVTAVSEPPGCAVPRAASETRGDAAALTPDAARGRLITRICVAGLSRTERHVLDRELLVAQGQPLRREDLEESVQRLKNLRIFREVESSLASTPDGGVLVQLRVAEKWTTIPIVRFGGGGGTAFFIIGAYDINALGRYLELGGQYENLGGNHSGVVWFRDPRFLNKRLRLGFDLWSVTRVRSLYSLTGKLEGAFELRRTKLNSFVDKELHRYVTVGGGIEANFDRFEDEHLDAKQRAANELTSRERPAAGQTFLGRTMVTLGRLNYEDYLVDGATLESTLEWAPPFDGSDFSFYRGQSDLRAFVLLPGRINLGGRVSVGSTSAKALQHIYYIGGLDYLRGMRDGQLRGSSFWQANVEARFVSLHTSWLVLQHTGFFDAGDAASSAEALLRRPGVIGTSAGAGIRLISPRIYRLVLRLDYAFVLSPQRAQGVAFGVQQFF